MKTNITDEHYRSLQLPLAEPHFDEEATLLRARPVVPIELLTPKRGSTPSWAFGIGLAGALLLGVGATALYYSQFRATRPLAVPNIETVSSGAQGVAIGTVALDRPLTEATDTNEATVGASSSVEPDTSARVKAPPVSWATRPFNSARRRSTGIVDESSEAEYETHELRGAKRVVVDESSEAEYETREERRGAKREARERKSANRERRVGRSSEELLRIRDIFEGPPRP